MSIPRSFSQSEDTEDEPHRFRSPGIGCIMATKSVDNIPGSINILVDESREKPVGPKSVTLDRRQSKNAANRNVSSPLKNQNLLNKQDWTKESVHFMVNKDCVKISSEDSLYDSFESTCGFDRRLGSLRGSKRGNVGTLHRSDSGDHLVIDETIIMDPQPER